MISKSEVGAGPGPVDLVAEAVHRVAGGGMVLVLDDINAANGANLVIAAEAVDRVSAAFMVRHGSGLLCAAIDEARADILELPPMVDERTDRTRSSYAVSVDARAGIGSGISAEDRATTLRLLADRTVDWSMLRRPGHVFPLRCHGEGVLGRPGRPEAALDLVRLAGRGDVAALCRAVSEDGSLLEGDGLTRFAACHDLPMLTLRALVAHRLRHELVAEDVVSVTLPTPIGEGEMHLCKLRPVGEQHVAYTVGDLQGGGPVLCHVHQECFEGDVLRSSRCDCRAELERATDAIASAGAGVLVYLRGDAERKLDRPHVPVSASTAGQILKCLRVESVILCGGDDLLAAGLDEIGVTIAGVLALADKGVSADLPSGGRTTRRSLPTGAA